MVERKRREAHYKGVWRRMPDFFNGYVKVRTWEHIKTGAMWQASDEYGGRGGLAMHLTAKGDITSKKEFSNYRKALEYVAEKVGCGYPNAINQGPQEHEFKRRKTT